MATVLLSAAGAAVGGSIGGTFAGLSKAVIGRAIGATLGKVVDQRLMGQGSDVVESGQVDRFRLTNAGEGEPIAQVYGRMRIGGQIIWASDFRETTTVTGGGGKGSGPSQPTTKEYSYSVSLAIAICEGEIVRIGRVWADGEEIAPDDLNMRVYTGNLEQLPDPAMEAVEGTGSVPAYRGTAYVVMEDLALQIFGNRVPQFSFEVIRPEQPDEEGAENEMTRAIKAVALMPGTGEYALATTPVYYTDGSTGRWSANVNSPAGKSDFALSVESLGEELPNCEAASLIVSWFGDDLRCGNCTLRPKVERKDIEGQNMPWSVSGMNRAQVSEIAQAEGRPIYGGTPSDASVIEAIKAMNAAQKAVMFYPFILMDQVDGNTLPDPYSDADTQPNLPWRGRITTSKAPGIDGSVDGTAAAQSEVDAFFGTATAAHFSIGAGIVTYSGPQEWSLSRFILHYAALCAAAGGVDAFCISSEMRGLTQIRGEANSFPTVTRLVALAGEVRALVGPNTKISYASDWSEYFGYQPQDGTGDRFFHLDPLWSDPNIDFIGIDNYMPLSDWREGQDHTDAAFGDIYNLEYLTSNIEGGEGYDWYYHSVDAEAAQIRTPITDGAESEPWVYRYKDLRSFWSLVHHERIAGVRMLAPTAWEPQSKPIWFTEMGCAAIDKGTNEPNKFLDQKSSESSLPKHSTGARDDLIQKQYLHAMATHWNSNANNPTSELYDGRMIDMTRAFVWAWDTRPYPFFPNNLAVWSDGENYARGHWINGRTSSRSLASVVSEICDRAGLKHYDISGLYGYVRGYVNTQTGEARASLQPLMLRYAFDAIERDGVLYFVMRDGHNAVDLDRGFLALSGDLDGSLEQTRDSEADLAGRVRVKFVQADANFEAVSEEAVLSDDATHAVSSSQVPLALTRAEGRQVSERWLTESRLARDMVRMALPLSKINVGAGDVVRLSADGNEGSSLYRVDRVEHGASQLIDAVRIEPEVYVPSDISEELARVEAFVAPVPVVPLFLDLPLITGSETVHAPYIAATGVTWPGDVAVYQSSTDEDYVLNSVLSARSTMGLTQNAMASACSSIIDHGADLQVKLTFGALSSITQNAMLAGGNLAAIGDGSTGRWEVFQFRDAEIVAPGTYALRHRLRGQLGTDGLMPDAWPENSWFVLLNGLPQQINLASNLRNVAQNFLIGPARRSYDDPSYLKQSHAFAGNGLRPYAPVHVRANLGAGDHGFEWTRRTRFDGDDWDALDVPLNEETERYQVRVSVAGAVLREDIVDTPNWTYAVADRGDDGIAGLYSFEVAQVSARFGTGLFRSIEVV
jgi:hypothetical protein